MTYLIRCLTHSVDSEHFDDEGFEPGASDRWAAAHLAWSMRSCNLVRVDVTEPEPESEPEPPVEQAAPGPVEPVRLEITPAMVDGVIVAFRHGLGSTNVLIKAYAGDVPIGYAFANAVDDDEVEVGIVDGTTALTAESGAETEEETDA